MGLRRGGVVPFSLKEPDWLGHVPTAWERFRAALLKCIYKFPQYRLPHWPLLRCWWEGSYSAGWKRFRPNSDNTKPIWMCPWGCLRCLDLPEVFLLWFVVYIFFLDAHKKNTYFPSFSSSLFSTSCECRSSSLCDYYRLSRQSGGICLFFFFPFFFWLAIKITFGISSAH